VLHRGTTLREPRTSVHDGTGYAAPGERSPGPRSWASWPGSRPERAAA
jgi:hypothetical protein